LGKMRSRAPAMLAAASALPSELKTQDSGLKTQDSLFPGISPHAPYTVEGPVLRACIRQALIKRLPIAMHLAELADETPFLRDLSGPLGNNWDLMQKMDILDDRIPLLPGSGGPIRWGQLWGLLLSDARETR